MKKLKRLVDANEFMTSELSREWNKRVNKAMMRLVQQALKEGISLLDLERLMMHSASFACVMSLHTQMKNRVGKR